MEFNAAQIKKDLLINVGQYPFKVIDATEKKSINGNDLINLRLSLLVNDRPVTMWASLILLPRMFWQIEHFCLATGIPEKIDQGKLTAENCYDQEGYLEIAHRVNKQTGEVEAYVKDYVKPENIELSENEHDALFNDDLPVSFT